MQSSFVHPSYQMDDIITLVHSMIALGKRVKIALVPFPVVSGPTSGDGFKEELREWARQARRWTVGAAEVFHYLCVKFKAFDLLSGITYGSITHSFLFHLSLLNRPPAVHFTHYYGLILCGMSLLNLAGLIASVGVHWSGRCVPAAYLPSASLAFLPLIGVALPYAVFAAVFVLDRVGLRYTSVKENVSLVRNLAHWLSMPLVLLAYSFVEAYAILKLSIFGAFSRRARRS